MELSTATPGKARGRPVKLRESSAFERTLAVVEACFPVTPYCRNIFGRPAGFVNLNA